MNLRKSEARHPGIRWALGALEFAIVDAMLIFGIVPAWAAAVSIPLPDRTIAIDLGDLPSWIVAFVAAAGLWKAWRAEQKVSQLGVKIDGMLVDRDAAKVQEGKAEEKIVAAAAADQHAKGVEVGIAQERASVSAANPAPVSAATPVAPSGIVAGEAPVPVTDEAAERVAKATETLAAVAERAAEKKP